MATVSSIPAFAIGCPEIVRTIMSDFEIVHGVTFAAVRVNTTESEESSAVPVE